MLKYFFLLQKFEVFVSPTSHLQSGKTMEIQSWLSKYFWFIESEGSAAFSTEKNTFISPFSDYNNTMRFKKRKLGCWQILSNLTKGDDCLYLKYYQKRDLIFYETFPRFALIIWLRWSNRKYNCDSQSEIPQYMPVHARC